MFLLIQKIILVRSQRLYAKLNLLSVEIAFLINLNGKVFESIREITWAVKPIKTDHL